MFRFAFLAVVVALAGNVAFAGVRTLRVHRAKVTSLAWSPDGTTIASGDGRGAVVLSDVRTGHTRLRFAYREAVSSLAYSPDGKLLAVGRGREVRLLNAQTGALVRALKTTFPVSKALKFSRDGRRLMASEVHEEGTSGYAVSVWNAQSGQLLGRWTEKEEEIDGATLSPDGTRVVAGVGDGGTDLTLWSVASGQKIGMWIDRSQEDLPVYTALDFSRDGQQLASVGGYVEAGGHIDIWNAGGKRAWGQSFDDWTICAAFSPHDRLLAVGTAYDTVYADKPRADGGDVMLFDLRTHKLQRTLKGHKAQVEALAWSPDGQQIASASDDKTVKIWRLTL